VSFAETDIRWTDKNHNPVHGCAHSGSPGCAHCYAERISRRFGHTEQAWTPANATENIQFKPAYLEDRLGEPAWVFANSMGDLLHPAIPYEFRDRLYAQYSEMPRSAFQILTKHGADHDLDAGHPPDNVMLGVSVGHPDWRGRIDGSATNPPPHGSSPSSHSSRASRTSTSPGSTGRSLGGESHPDPGERREMDPAWAQTLVERCRRQDVAVFFKQHSGPRPEIDIELDMGDGPTRIEEFPRLPDGVQPAPRAFLAVADGGGSA
jgi:protein gp37